jgi:hypothetical protein
MASAAPIMVTQMKESDTTSSTQTTAVDST